MHMQELFCKNILFIYKILHTYSCELIVFVSGQADRKNRIVSIFMT